VFTRSGSTWSQQGDKLTGGHFDEPGIRFGESVALAGDGDRALIGAPSGADSHERQGAGSAWVFTRSGSTWTQQGEGLFSGQGGHYEAFGLRVALSREGNAALIGHREGFELPPALPAAAWVFTRSGTTWTKQIPPLTCGGEGCGATAPWSQQMPTVALSGDASTALVGTAVYVNSTQEEEEHQ
jgi:hypothetical protein